MMPPNLTVCLTIYNRPLDVLGNVFRSIEEEDFDQMIICLDRSPAETRSYVQGFWYNDARAKIVEIAGKPGWLCPAKAWNTAFERVESELTYCISSEVIQARGNITRAKKLLSTQPAVIFGKAECSCGPYGTEVNWNGAAPGNLFTDAAHPRPLGFIMALPTWTIRAIGGYDEAFMQGYWYDDDDFTYRIFQLGVRFMFDDSISGIHQHHERPELTPEGIECNRLHMLSKWGTCDLWKNAKFTGLTYRLLENAGRSAVCGMTVWNYASNSTIASLSTKESHPLPYQPPRNNPPTFET